MLYSVDDIKSNFPATRFNSGLRLFSSGVITAPNVQRNGELVTAVIPHPRGKGLRVYARVLSKAGNIQIHGECTCVQRTNCEHVAAVLLQALADREAINTDFSADKSLNDIPSRPATEIQQRLIYLLELDLLNGTDIVQVTTRVARTLKNGAYGHAVNYEPGRALRGTPPRFLQPEDVSLLGALARLKPAGPPGCRQLGGSGSGALLNALLDTQNCFWVSADSAPLKKGDLHTLEFSWTTDPQGTQSLSYTITDSVEAELKLLPLNPPWYLDEINNQCGPLDCDLPDTVVDHLLQMPPVPAEQTEATQQDLIRRFPEHTLPPLQKRTIHDIACVKPRPCLRLVTEVFDDSWDEDGLEDFAVLSFDYNGVELHRTDLPRRLVDNQIVRWKRDQNTENACVRQLENFGFEQDDYWSGKTNKALFFLSGDSDEWLNLQIELIPLLRREGWSIEYDERFRYRVATAQRWLCHAESGDDQEWFNVGLGVEIDGERVDLLGVLLQLLREYPRGLPTELDDTLGIVLRLEDGRLLPVPTQRLRPVYATLLELYENGSLNGQQLRLSRIQLPQLLSLDTETDELQLHWKTDSGTLALIERLKNVNEVPVVAPPVELQAQLRAYQQRGLDWLQFLREYRLAGILADDMGLGKTVQALAHVLLEKQQGRLTLPCLVIAPTSLVFNWKREAARFTPALKVLALQGPQRHTLFDDISQHDLILTTYPLLPRDESALLAHHYHLVILDEAQIIKNPKAKASHIVRRINTRHRLCLSGTPLENHLGELWSLFDFLLPGLLGNEKQFRRFFRTPIEKHAETPAMERLVRRIRPYLLRRTKEAVTAELPSKTEIIRSVALQDEQRDLYESVRMATHLRVRREIEQQGIARSHIIILDALLKLRQVCCDPRLVKIDSAKQVKTSAKLDMLMELLPEMIEEGRRILVFSQFTGMLSLIEEAVQKHKFGYVKLTGQTRNRAAVVERFQAREVPLFLISLKAGGVGLNLTAADTVIHYDPWWNPAAERQATDRAHRIGQEQPVFVYKLICEGTVEEKIQAMQARKQSLADGLYNNQSAAEPQWNEADLEQLFSPLSDN